jgi:hypothetical protein
MDIDADPVSSPRGMRVGHGIVVAAYISRENTSNLTDVFDAE